MTTNGIKHNMLREAKRIVNLYNRNMELTENIEDLEILTLETGVRIEINRVLSKHPEFDAKVFRGMIKEIQTRNKKNESAV